MGRKTMCLVDSILLFDLRGVIHRKVGFWKLDKNGKKVAHCSILIPLNTYFECYIVSVIPLQDLRRVSVVE